MSDEVDPVFPVEIERVIFLLCGRSNLEEVKTLVLVAKRVHYWLMPLLFKVVALHADMAPEKSRLQREQLDQYGKNVRHLMIWEKTSSTPGLSPLALTPITYLSLCHNVVDLALWGPKIRYDQAMIDQLKRLRLTHLSFNLSLFHSGVIENSVSMPISFPRITHLELVGTNLALPPQQARAYFPSVTHIALDHQLGPWAPGVLQCWNDRLRLMVCHVNHNHIAEARLGPPLFWATNDRRVVFRRQGKEVVPDWKANAMSSSESFWRAS